MARTRARTSIVVGAGIRGLCGAIALGKAGIETRVFDRAPELTEVGAGIWLWANGLRALDALGMADPVRAIGGRVVGGIRRSDGRLLARPIPEAMLRRYPDACL